MSTTPEAREGERQDGDDFVLPPVDFALGDRDVRSKRPPLLSFLLKLDTLRRVTRVVSLLVLDFVGIFAGDPHRAVPEGRAEGRVGLRGVAAGGAGHRRLRLPRRGAAVRALGPVRRPRLAAGPRAHRLGADPDDARDADLRPRQRRALLQLLHLLRLAVLLGRLRLDAALRLRARSPARCCAPPATSAAPCSSAPASTSRPSPTRWPTARTRASRSSASSRCARAPTTGCARSARSTTSRQIIAKHGLDEVIIADPDFPQKECVELVDRCHQRGVRVRVAPSTMEVLIHRAEFVPGQSVPLFELKPPVFDGIDFAVKRDVRHHRREPAAALPVAGAAGQRAGDQGLVARPADLPLVAAGHRRPAVRLPEVPHDVPRRRPSVRTTSRSTTRPRARSSR